MKPFYVRMIYRMFLVPSQPCLSISPEIAIICWLCYVTDDGARNSLRFCQILIFLVEIHIRAVEILFLVGVISPFSLYLVVSFCFLVGILLRRVIYFGNDFFRFVFFLGFLFPCFFAFRLPASCLFSSPRCMLFCFSLLLCFSAFPCFFAALLFLASLLLCFPCFFASPLSLLFCFSSLNNPKIHTQYIYIYICIYIYIHK